MNIETQERKSRDLSVGKVVIYQESKTARTICKIRYIIREEGGYVFGLQAVSKEGKRVWGIEPFNVRAESLSPPFLIDTKI